MLNINLIIKGWVQVNIPVAIIMFTVWYILIVFFKIDSRASIIISVIPGWVYWEFAIAKWVKWALDNKVDSHKLLRIGQFSLLLWNKRTIDKVIDKNQF